MYAKKVVEESSQSEVVQEDYQSFNALQVKREKKLKGNFITRVIGRREKGFDYNQDGKISPEERKFFLKMRQTREQEKILRGEK